ncbi:[FeFe]-hydrogenase maturation radical SAM domain iron-sulfur cluster-binding oxidoreductase HydE [Syntrophotalea carbinolica DSM 2380]|uniref:[FeFe]-hydrogenase maturation radical SAM domain iron-sulfur cluster-binding oxidoreductase HydE n=1 Tax=Syntrophotalea carbinolica (strain DSM 2380 / NBRC 103641 / GraBd1) TaxID=338963 RepID=Q3A456_SYNC1|nr:[FeFe] hydrogenase H-cluster radical SAM maturase HydE [Syntrophotalea carbinolica]ABA88851.1 [FeFe]-hydrogenase maturation radical SAM domain iron-sulfur cluster-binding oxidoreductase HydE [Syntrophotalea carbinolica DSM 2380]
MTKELILHWLKTTDARQVARLWKAADDVRRQYVGDDILLRGLLEFSNFCDRNCWYCGLRADNTTVERYRMSEDEILDCAHKGMRYGYGTIVLQSGEDYGMSAAWMENVIRRIKRETNLAITLSLGERAGAELSCWKTAGADRYLLRFETSNRSLYDQIHPRCGEKGGDRIALLKKLEELGYEVGSGVMVGIPGQTYEDLANDIELFRSLGLSMIGVGPYIPHTGTPLGYADKLMTVPDGEQVPCSEEMPYRVIALTRLVCPSANIPTTTALATLNISYGRELGLSRGANIVMPNLTPKKYRPMYEIYPSKACIDETAADCRVCMHRRIASIGRTVGR